MLTLSYLIIAKVQKLIIVAIATMISFVKLKNTLAIFSSLGIF